MSPASNLHGRMQMKIGGNLMNKLPKGEVIAECSIQTSDGVKVADIAWASAEFIDTFAYKTPYPKAPEICVEIVSPSNSKEEISNKVDLYLAKGAIEVWIVYEENRTHIFTHTGRMEKSHIVPDAKIKT
ncbi:Uma2 family endonuclease [Methyloprofundus sp.]|uniref:Uma2 family endonuclease n=1 Tax=Methyloprofundus sp. TaxID=2020875 RepID=UPI003D12C291